MKSSRWSSMSSLNFTAAFQRKRQHCRQAKSLEDAVRQRYVILLLDVSFSLTDNSGACQAMLGDVMYAWDSQSEQVSPGLRQQELHDYCVHQEVWNPNRRDSPQPYHSLQGLDNLHSDGGGCNATRSECFSPMTLQILTAIVDFAFWFLPPGS